MTDSTGKAPRGPGYEFYQEIVKAGELVTVRYTVPGSLPLGAIVTAVVKGDGGDLLTLPATATVSSDEFTLAVEIATTSLDAGPYRIEFEVVGAGAVRTIYPRRGVISIYLEASLDTGEQIPEPGGR